MSIIRIGFTGNRYGLNEEQRNQIINLLDKYDNMIILHGDCIGSDTDFHNLCINYRNLKSSKKIIIHIYPPDKSTLRGFNKGDLIMDMKPYLDRNMDIINNSDLLVACPFDKNKEELRSGTWSTIRQARKKKMKIYIY